MDLVETFQLWNNSRYVGVVEIITMIISSRLTLAMQNHCYIFPPYMSDARINGIISKYPQMQNQLKSRNP